MKTTILACLAVLFHTMAFGQDPNTGVTVTVNGSINLTPSDVSFEFGLASGTSTTLDDVIAALQDLGVTARNLCFGPSTQLGASATLAVIFGVQ